MLTLKDFDFRDKKVLVRCDFNVSLSEGGEILDDFRIRATLPTIKYLIETKAKIILMSHLSDDRSLEPIAQRLEELLKRKVYFSKEISKTEPREIVLLENLRLQKGEEENDESFARALANLGDIYINDAFGVCHRNHASVSAITKYLPSGAGFLLEKEIKVLTNLKESPEKPLVAIIGGAKVETKIKLIDQISQIADFVLIGSLLKKESREKNVNFANPEKIVMPEGEGFDISEKDAVSFQEKISLAKTIFWNGPLGKVEDEEFERGSCQIAEAIIESRAYSVVGGGETIWFLGKLGLINKFNHASTGGGAMLAFLSGEELPGLRALGYHDIA